MVPSTSVRSWCVKVTLLNRDIAMRKISYCTLLQSFSQAYGLHYTWLSIQLCVKVSLLNRDITLGKISYCNLLENFS